MRTGLEAKIEHLQILDEDPLSASSAEDAIDHEEVEYFPGEDSSDEATPPSIIAISILKR
ncbi:hypothetical protein JX266_014581, partial [Neoarthrinium moseri]